MMHKQVKEGKEGALHHKLFCTEEKNTEKVLNFFLGGTTGFSLYPRGLKARDDCILSSVIDLFLGISTSCNYAVMPAGYTFTSQHVTSCTQNRFHWQNSFQHQFNGLSGNLQY
jgi:hypothetical protein